MLCKIICKLILYMYFIFFKFVGFLRLFFYQYYIIYVLVVFFDFFRIDINIFQKFEIYRVFFFSMYCQNCCDYRVLKMFDVFFLKQY